MLIRKSKVYYADVYKAENYEEKPLLCLGDCVVGNIYYDKELMWKNAILIKMKDYFVPINLIRNPLDFVTLKMCSILKREPKGMQKFVHSMPSYGRELFVREPKKVFDDKGLVTDKDLSTYYIDEENYYYSKEDYPEGSNNIDEITK